MTPDDQPLGLICIGASAGGLRSIEAIVKRLPADLPWPVLISQHLQADRVSQMPEILARIANMPVQEATDGEAPRPGTIYTCPSSSEMGVTMEGRLSLRPPVEGPPQRIDHLFATASYARPGRTIAVVLSGTGSDGAVGALVVKLNHGLVITEDKESAEFASMPEATQRAVTVDATLKASAIATLLDDLARGSLESSSAAARVTVARIAEDISSPDTADFTRYRASTLRRQAEKRRALLGLPTLEAYRDRLQSDPEERMTLTRNLFIPVTEFFRDSSAWRTLEEQVVPALAQKARDGGAVRVWCAGCASGEEAYSIAILLAEAITDTSRIQVLATDLDPRAIASAKQGTFDASRLDRVDKKRRERFFRAEGHGYRANDDLRKMVLPRAHDLTRDPAPGQFDLIICRNLLIYFDERLQAQVLDEFYDALGGPRILFLGQSETIPPRQKAFVPLARSFRLFRAIGPAPARPDVLEPDQVRDLDHLDQSGAPAARIDTSDTFVLTIDDSWNIVSANAHARSVMAADLTGLALLDVFPRWNGSPIEDALRACFAKGESLKVLGAPTPQGPADVTLDPVPGSPGRILVIATPARSWTRTPADADDLHAREDLAATNDELQSANEELAAANEELQATNEELASLNEEFQSTNQTLASANVELGEVAKTTRASTDLVNEFLQGRLDAIVACDPAQRVTFFNRQASELFQLEAAHIGRPIDQMNIGVPGATIASALNEAMDQPRRLPVLHAKARLFLTVEHVRDLEGTPLGWVLSWALR